MKLLGYMVLPLTLICLLVFTVGNADAKRFGGGSSFGSKPSYSNTYRKPTYSPSSTQRQASGTNTGQSGFARPGMGLFGGLLAGTFLGSMFGGYGGMGGGGIFNLLIIGLLVYLGFKFFRNRSRGSDQMYQQGNYQRGPDRSDNNKQSYDADPFARRESAARNAWDHLSSTPTAQKSSGSDASGGPSVNIPAGFDQEEFLEGAKAVYTRLQKSWDNRDMDDIAQFATPDVVAEIRKQAQEDPGPSQTDVMMVNARVLEVRDECGRTAATVFYDVLLREDPSSSQPSQVREVWHFVKDPGKDAMWKLDGIQQLEN
ncbi:TIM44-like domain-containing protein [Maridesulfovibrio sp.]|uniref:Tim44 domain-containing protein n=1 Tax=Maridesulfovibrio sp. TaxID=2795000 RepID=UPI002A18DDD7|nr:TIM44-like domain-containing protein [Maridesulfovibrio sp.]